MAVLTRPEGVLAQDLHLSRRGIAGLFFAGFAAAALSAHADPVRTDETGLITQTVVVQAPDRAIPAYVAMPARGGPFPAVIVVSEIFGVHEYIRDVCRRLAKLGYAAIAPAFFIRAGDPAALTDMAAIMKIVQATPDAQVLSDIGATIAFLKGQPNVIDDRLAITGFCWGGKFVWLACERFPDFRAGASWYGRLAPSADTPADPNALWPINGAANLNAPVLGLYGGQDPLSQSVPAMRAALDAAHKTGSEIIVYPDAGHGFHADYRATYNGPDAQDGWMRMLAHFALNGAVSHHDPANHHAAAVSHEGRRGHGRGHHERGGHAEHGHHHGGGHGAKRSGRSTHPHPTHHRRGHRG
jgi:carboxymethylenebutenolidase